MGDILSCVGRLITGIVILVGALWAWSIMPDWLRIVLGIFGIVLIIYSVVSSGNSSGSSGDSSGSSSDHETGCTT